MAEISYPPGLSQAETAFFRKLLDKYQLRPFESFLAPFLEPCIGLEVMGPDDYSALGESRLGGVPDWPAGWEWPMVYNQTQAGRKAFPMAFTCQIDLAAIAHLASPLPKAGLLYFFWDDYDEPFSGCVRHYTGPLAELTRPGPGRPPSLSESLLAIPFDETLAGCPHRLQFHGALSLPISGEFHRLFRGTLPFQRDEEFQHYLALSEELNGPWSHYLFGYHFCQQSLLDMGRPGADDAAAGITLLCINSDERLGIDFLGYDQVHMMISRESLRQQDFSQIHLSREKR